VHPPGVEPGPIAWKAIILPLDQECLMKILVIKWYIEQRKNWPGGGVDSDLASSDAHFPS
jgi:hypothetical protein